VLGLLPFAAESGGTFAGLIVVLSYRLPGHAGSPGQLV
jgi:hypothetical protein